MYIEVLQRLDLSHEQKQEVRRNGTTWKATWVLYSAFHTHKGKQHFRGDWQAFHDHRCERLCLMMVLTLTTSKTFD